MNQDDQNSGSETEPGVAEGVLPERTSDPPIWPWILPLAAYLLLLMFDPKLDDNPYANGSDSVESLRPVAENVTNEWQDQRDPLLDRRADEASNRASPGEQKPLNQGKILHYTLMTLLRFLVVGGILVACFGHYRKQFPLRVGFWWLPTGIVGVILWIWLCDLNLESRFLEMLGFETEALGARAAFNPFEAFGTTGWLFGFLAIRFAILVIAVPLAEEIFLRGFLMRMLQRPDWWKANLGNLKWWILAVAPVYGIFTHPSEFVAATVWFSLVTVLMVFTRNLWECVLAHAVTNLLLGIYVILFSQWQLW